MLRSVVGVLVLALGGAFAAGCGEDAPERPPATTQLVVHVTDGPGGLAIPAKMLLADGSGTRLRIGHLDFLNGKVQDKGFCELADGAIGTWDGIALARGDSEINVGVPVCDAAPAIPYGKYHLKIMRGAEYEPFEQDVDLTDYKGRVAVEAPLLRAFVPDGVLSADLHVHSENSGDSIVPRRIRVITEAAAGIQVIGSSDHNYNADYAPEIEALSMQGLVASIAGNEVSIGIGHFNVFPVVIDRAQPKGGSLGDVQIQQWSARTLFDAVRALPGQPLLQVNHPRLGYAAYYDLAGWNGTWPPPMPIDFDAVEVLTGWTMFSLPDDRRLERSVSDFYAFAQNGHFVTALGNSDTHHLNGILAGFPRSYVRMDDTRLAPFDEAGFIAAVRGRRVLATSGPYLEVKVGGVAAAGETAPAVAGGVDIEIHLRQASFVHATRVRLWVQGQVRRTLEVPPGARAFDWSGHETVGSMDTWVGADAAGDQPLPEDLAGDYLSDRGGMLPFALVNPILIDADGDGRVTIAHVLPAPSVDVQAPRFMPGREHGPYDCGEPPRTPEK